MAGPVLELRGAADDGHHGRGHAARAPRHHARLHPRHHAHHQREDAQERGPQRPEAGRDAPGRGVLRPTGEGKGLAIESR